MSVITLDHFANDPTEPTWTAEIPGRSRAAIAERQAAGEYWRTIVRELRGTNKLALANAHAIKRLTLAMIIYDRALIQVAKHGPVIAAPKTGTPMHNPWFTVMIQAGKTVTTLESDLTITPRSRDDGGAVPPPPRKPTGSDRYLSRQKD
jgi:P27 family predicted phage terminase small subunit